MHAKPVLLAIKVFAEYKITAGQECTGKFFYVFKRDPKSESIKYSIPIGHGFLAICHCLSARNHQCFKKGAGPLRLQHKLLA